MIEIYSLDWVRIDGMNVKFSISIVYGYQISIFDSKHTSQPVGYEDFKVFSLHL